MTGEHEDSKKSFNVIQNPTINFENNQNKVLQMGMILKMLSSAKDEGELEERKQAIVKLGWEQELVLALMIHNASSQNEAQE